MPNNSQAQIRAEMPRWKGVKQPTNAPVVKVEVEVVAEEEAPKKKGFFSKKEKAEE